jgi:hypothetical protein
MLILTKLSRAAATLAGSAGLTACVSIPDEELLACAVGIMTDTDNTRQKARCQYGGITSRRAQ